MVKPFIAGIARIASSASKGRRRGSRRAGARLNGVGAIEEALEEIVSGFEDMPTWVIVANAHYAPYVEEGSAGSPPQPFMGPAVRSVARRADAIWSTSATPEDFMARMAFEIEAEARHRAPVDTGHLRNSIQARRQG